MCNENFQMYKLDLEKEEEPEIKLQKFVDHRKSERIPKKIYFCFIDYAKSFDLYIATNYEKFLKIWKYQTILPAFWETCMQIKEQKLEPVMKQLTQIGKGIRQGWILSPCVFNLYAECIMQNAKLNEAQVGVKMPGEIWITSDMQMTPL